MAGPPEGTSRLDAARLAALIGAVQWGVLVEDAERRISLVNEEFLEVFQIPATPEQVLGVDCSQAAEQSKHLARDPERFVRRIDEILAARLPVRGEEVRFADGRIFSRDYVPIEIDGVPEGQMWGYRDITDRTEIREALAHQSAFLSRLIDLTPDAIFTVDDEGVVTSWNQGATRIYGWQRDEAVGRRSVDLVAGGVVGAVEEIESFREAARATGGATRHGLAVRRRRDGSAVEVDEFSAPVALQGGREGWLVVTHDLTRLRQLEEEQRRSEARAVAAISTSLDAILSIDHDGVVIAFNEAAEGMFGIDASAAIGRPLADLIVPEELRAAHTAGIARYLETGHSDVIGRRVELEAVRMTGERFPVELAIRHVTSADRPFFTGTVRDISERRRYEREIAEARDAALEATRLKSEFLAVMSHEIRSPLYGLSATVDLLARSSLDDEQREHVRVLEESSAALRAVIDDVLDLSRIEARHVEVVDGAIDVVGLVEGVADIFGARARAKGLALQSAVDPRLPALVGGDERLVRQIVTNLVANAVKFTERGDVVVRAEPAAAGLWRLVVEDTGIGFGPEVAERIFEPFTQADASLGRRYGGTGLGLAISRRLADLLGGAISATSAPGAGAAFVVELPLRAADGARELVGEEEPLAGARLRVVPADGLAAGAVRATLAALGAQVVAEGDRPARALRLGPAGPDEEVSPDDVLVVLPVGRDALARTLTGDGARSPAGEPPARSASPLLVLVVDDNEVNRLVALRQLEAIGHAAEAVASGAEALERVAAGGVDVVLLDLRMPELDGFETARRMRSGPHGDDVAIVALTADIFDTEEASAAAGMDGRLRKPVSLADLAAAIEEVRSPAPAGGEAPVGAAPVGAGAEHLLADLCDRGAVEQIVRVWLEELPTRLGVLRAAIAAGELDEVRAASHRLRSATAVFGPGAVVDAAATVERAAHDGRIDERGAAVLERCADAAAADLRAWLDGSPSQA